MGNNADYYQPRIASEHVRKLYALGRLLRKPMTQVLADMLERAFKPFVFAEEAEAAGDQRSIGTYRAELREAKPERSDGDGPDAGRL